MECDLVELGCLSDMSEEALLERGVDGHQAFDGAGGTADHVECRADRGEPGRRSASRRRWLSARCRKALERRPVPRDAADGELVDVARGRRADSTSSRMRPAARMATRSHSASASGRMCDEKMTVVPSRAQRADQLAHAWRPIGSSPDIGSSRMSRRGRLMIACAMPTRCSVPFERVRIGARRLCVELHPLDRPRRRAVARGAAVQAVQLSVDRRASPAR